MNHVQKQNFLFKRAISVTKMFLKTLLSLCQICLFVCFVSGLAFKID